MQKYPNIKISWTKLYRATLHTHRYTHTSLGGRPSNTVQWEWKCFRAGGGLGKKQERLSGEACAAQDLHMEVLR